MNVKGASQMALVNQRRDFRPYWKPVALVSAVLVLISLGSFVFRGLDRGIEFEGGGVWEVPDEDNDTGAIQNAMADVGFGGASIQEVTVGDQRFFRVRADVTELGTEADSITDALAAVTGASTDDIGVSTVGPSWGDEITGAAVRALVVFFLVMAAYISWRLEWRMAIGALVAVVHDIIITVGVYSVFQFDVTPATVIAFLTIMGYSLYDTIVVYDRARENAGRYAASGRITYPEVMSLSLDQVFMRSINTTITSVLPVLSMLLIGAGLLGAVTLKDFALALLIGLIAGGYSSIFIAAPIVVILKSREEVWQRAVERSGAKAARTSERSSDSGIVGDDDGVSDATPDGDERSPVSASSQSGTAGRPSSAPPATGLIEPRARKKRRR